MNTVFASLVKEKIDLLRHLFSGSSRRTFVDEKTGKLIHPGEFGTYRERIIRDFLQLCVPCRLDIGSGFLIAHDGQVSTQTDIVIYDKTAAPRIESNDDQRFFPVEAVCAIGEVKSILSKTDLKNALIKLSKTKSVADALSSTLPLFKDRNIKIEQFNRKINPYDQIVSFLICEKFDFDATSLPKEVDGWYEDIKEDYHKHNFVLSIEDGLLAYVGNSGKTWMYPPTAQLKARNRFVATENGSDVHINLFCDYVFHTTSSTTILFPEMVSYMPPLSGGSNYDG